MTHSIGLYVHVPFCMPAKCPYCDFYSVRLTDTLAKRYTQALKIAAHAYAKRLSDCVITSIYFGGGTPTLLEEQLTELLTYFQATFHVASNAEITVEANPGGNLETILPQLHAAGSTRLSLGMQSAPAMELCSLGRQHTMLDTCTSSTSYPAAE